MLGRQSKDGREDPKRGWADRVAFDDVGGYAYRPREVLTTGGDAALDVARRTDRAIREGAKVGPFTQLADVGDPVRLAAELRMNGFTSGPNHLFFTGSGGCCPPHPATPCGPSASPVYATPVYATPVYATPVYATPVYATPVYATSVSSTPVYATPVYATPVYATEVYGQLLGRAYRSTGIRKSSARPAPEDPAITALLGTKAVKGSPRIVVLDTGLAAKRFQPAALDTNRIKGDDDRPDNTGDNLLDPAAGHGTFIAGLIDQVAPGCEITVRSVISTLGDGDELAIAAAIDAVADEGANLLNLSFSGYALEQPACLAWAVRKAQDAGVVVVASAGNDGTCRPTYPAAFPGVVSVGAVGPTGPAPFSNYGPWVRACAPGVDLVSTFFEGFQGATPAPPDGADPDDFKGWAMWSGTSFSGPVVVGALARAMQAGATGAQAVARVIDDPRLMRIPNLGTVVNVM